MTPEHQAILDRYRAALAKLEATGPFTIDDGLACIKAAYELRHYVYPHLPASDRQALLDEIGRVRALGAGAAERETHRSGVGSTHD